MNTTLRTLINKALADADSLVKEGSKAAPVVATSNPVNDIEKLANALNYISTNLGNLERSPEEKLAEFEVFLSKIGALEGFDGGVPVGFGLTPLSPGDPANSVPNDLGKVDPTMGQTQAQPMAASSQPVPPAGEMPVRPGDPATANLTDDAARLAFGASSKTAALSLKAKLGLGAAGLVGLGGAGGVLGGHIESNRVGLEGEDRTKAKFLGGMSAPSAAVDGAVVGGLAGASKMLRNASKASGPLNSAGDVITEVARHGKAGLKLGLPIAAGMAAISGIGHGRQMGLATLGDREAAKVKAAKQLSKSAGLDKEAILSLVAGHIGSENALEEEGQKQGLSPAQMEQAKKHKGWGGVGRGFLWSIPGALAGGALGSVGGPMGSTLGATAGSIAGGYYGGTRSGKYHAQEAAKTRDLALAQQKTAGYDRLLNMLKMAADSDNPAQIGGQTEDPPLVSPDPIGTPVGGPAMVPIAQSSEAMINTSPLAVANANKDQMLQFISENGQDGTLGMLDATKMAAAKDRVLNVVGDLTGASNFRNAKHQMENARVFSPGAAKTVARNNAIEQVGIGVAKPLILAGAGKAAYDASKGSKKEASIEDANKARVLSFLDKEASVRGALNVAGDITGLSDLSRAAKSQKFIDISSNGRTMDLVDAQKVMHGVEGHLLQEGKNVSRSTLSADWDHGSTGVKEVARARNKQIATGTGKMALTAGASKAGIDALNKKDQQKSASMQEVDPLARIKESLSSLVEGMED